MSGTVRYVNKAMMRPLLIGGVEKRLMLMNSLLSFALVAATHFHFPVCLMGVGLFIVLHIVFRFISKHDPQVMTLFKRSTRYIVRPYFPAKSHAVMLEIWPVNSISRLR